MSAPTTKWILFFSMCAIVPVFYFMFVVAGFLPLLAVFLIALNNGSWAVILISAVHCVIYAALFYFVSSAGSHRLGRLSPSQRNKKLSVILGSLLLIGALPIYGGGHGRFEWRNAYQIYLNYQWLR